MGWFSNATYFEVSTTSQVVQRDVCGFFWSHNRRVLILSKNFGCCVFTMSFSLMSLRIMYRGSVSAGLVTATSSLFSLRAFNS